MLFQIFLHQLKEQVEKNLHLNSTVISTQLDLDPDFEFEPTEEWTSWDQEFKSVLASFNQIIKKTGIIRLKAAYNFGSVLSRMYIKFKSEKISGQTWPQYIRNHNHLQIRQERKYRQLYNFVKDYPKLLYCELTIEKLTSNISNIKQGLKQFSHFNKYFQ